jgi:hypothetical protein
MSNIATRAFFIPGTERVVGPFGPAPYQSTAVLKAPDIKWYFEAIVPDSNKSRYKVTDRDIQFPVRELLVEIDRKKLLRLQRWKSFQHYLRYYDILTAGRGISDVSVPIVRIDNSVITEESCPVRTYREVPISGLFGATSYPNYGLESWFVDDDEDSYVREPEDLDELISASFKRLVPKVRVQVQLLNSLWEIKDFVLLRRTVSRVRSLGQSLKRKGVVGSLREVAGSAADVFLQWQFNIKPLIRDIEGIHKALVESLGRFRRLMQFDGVPQVTRYKRDLRGSLSRSLGKVDVVVPSYVLNPEYDIWFHPGGTSSGWTHDEETATVTAFRDVTVNKELFCAQLRFVARWTGAQHRYAEQLGLIDALGLSFNLKHVWDALPWSFVVDWVIKVGDFLDNYARGALDPVLDVLDYSWSISRQRDIELSTRHKRFKQADPSKLIEDKIVIYPTLRESAYRRQPVELGRIAPIVSGLSPKELTLATALILSRRQKLRKPSNRRRGRKGLLDKLKRVK